MPYKFNPFTGNLDIEGPVLTGSGTVSAAADGTQSIPGISFASDLNTGIYRPGADQLAISTGGTGRLFIDSSGNAGIGTSGPVGPLHVAGDTSADAEYSILNVSDTSDTTKGLRLAYDDVNDCGVIAASDRGSGWKNVAIAPILGNVGIGTASPAVACDVVGQVRASTGILFGSDTAAANALDDYEEGTWTPALVGVTGSNVNTSIYTKIGNVVRMVFRWRSRGTMTFTGTDVVEITGWPFNVAGNCVLVNRFNSNNSWSAFLAGHKEFIAIAIQGTNSVRLFDKTTGNAVVYNDIYLQPGNVEPGLSCELFVAV